MKTQRAYRLEMAQESRRGVRVDLAGDPSWLVEVEAAMTAKGWDRQTLAANAGISPASITRLFDGRPTDDMVRKVSRALELRDPILGFLADDQLRAWLDVGSRLRAQAPKRFQELLSALEAKLNADEAWTGALEKLGNREE